MMAWNPYEHFPMYDSNGNEITPMAAAPHYQQIHHHHHPGHPPVPPPALPGTAVVGGYYFDRGPPPAPPPPMERYYSNFATASPQPSSQQLHRHPFQPHHNNSRRNSSSSTASKYGTPPKPKQTRVYSDFRVGSIEIGSFTLNEQSSSSSADQSSMSSPGGGGRGGKQNNRDSRLRLYFKNSNASNMQPSQSPDLTEKERALTEPDRLSISLYQGTKRLVIPVQGGLNTVSFNRSEGRFLIDCTGWALFEQLDETSASRQFVKCTDFTNNQLSHACLIKVWIDKQNPLPMEPKWTRGNIGDYIDPRSKFRSQRVLKVEDPEHIVDFDSMVDLWTRESNIASVEERKQFASTMLPRADYMLELCSKVLAPHNYYVSKNSASCESAAARNAPLAAQIVETGSIPALISPGVNALLALCCQFAESQEPRLIEMLKLVLFKVPEPIVWRSLDGLFSKRHEPLNFDPVKLLDSIKN